MEIGAVAEATAVGGVWAIAAVSTEDWIEVKKGSKVRDDTGKIQDFKAVGNRFKILEEDISDEGPERDVKVECLGVSCAGNSRNLTFKKRIKNEKGERKHADETNNKDVKIEFAEICAVPFACCGCSGPPGLDVCAVSSSASGWRKIGKGEITIDSAAEESVCPKDWGAEFGTKEPARWLKFVNASGGAMGHYGERLAKFQVEGGKESAIMSLNFQVSDVQKPLAAVRRIVEKGNTVHFGPNAEDNFIRSATSGAKIMMVKKGGSYVVPAELMVEELGFTGRAQ
jgi:hypothetical protein